MTDTLASDLEELQKICSIKPCHILPSEKHVLYISHQSNQIPKHIHKIQAIVHPIFQLPSVSTSQSVIFSVLAQAKFQSSIFPSGARYRDVAFLTNLPIDTSLRFAAFFRVRGDGWIGRSFGGCVLQAERYRVHHDARIGIGVQVAGFRH